MPLLYDGGGLWKFSHSCFGRLQFPTLSNVAYSFLVAVDVISPLPSFIALKLGGPFHVFVFPILNL
jgi:hypothetical protein